METLDGKEHSEGQDVSHSGYAPSRKALIQIIMRRSHRGNAGLKNLGNGHRNLLGNGGLSQILNLGNSLLGLSGTTGLTAKTYISS